MPHSTNKELVLGIMVGTAGISLLVLWYHKVRKPRAPMSLPTFVSLGNSLDSVTFQEEMCNDEGTIMIFQRRQLQILEKLNELLRNVEELKEDIKFLKETIPKLEEYIQDELGGKITFHKTSPQHRARKRKPATIQTSATSNSSEEAESEGGCYKEDQIFQPEHTEDQATSELSHHEASSIPQPTISLGLITSRPSATYKNHSPKKRKFSPTSNTATPSYFSEKRQFLLAKFHANRSSLSRQRSRANFDFQEDINYNDKKSSSDLFGAVKSGRRFSSRKLSIVSCYKSSILFDPQSSNQDLLNLNEIELFSKIPSNPDIPKQKSFSDREYIPKHVISFDAKVPTAVRRNTIDRTFFPQSMTSFFSLPTVVSSSNQANRFAVDRQESSLLNKDTKDYLRSGFQSHTSYFPAGIQQSTETTTHSAFHNVGFSLSYENSSNFIQDQSNFDSDFIEEENLTESPEDEDNSLPAEVSKTRYMTANTDTEEQNFPVAKAFNTHVEELKLDVLLQKADHLRFNEAGKMESFELLCDHKEKFRDEIEFMWRFARAYGDMYELSTNTQEKKHYAHIGKSLGEKAINRAPTNGYCHLWYAVLCGCVSEFEGLQNKINYGHHFKEHLDVAIQLLPEEPFLYYLKGRYCYTISKLSWIEKKMAATLFGKIPSSSIQESLHNFLKAEELQSGYSMSNYMYLAKCCLDLEKNQDAWKFCNMALLLPIVSKEDKEAHKEVKKIIAALKRMHDFGKPRIPLQYS